MSGAHICIGNATSSVGKWNICRQQLVLHTAGPPFLRGSDLVHALLLPICRLASACTCITNQGSAPLCPLRFNHSSILPPKVTPLSYSQTGTWTLCPPRDQEGNEPANPLQPAHNSLPHKGCERFTHPQDCGRYSQCQSLCGCCDEHDAVCNHGRLHALHTTAECTPSTALQQCSSPDRPPCISNVVHDKRV